MTRIVDWAASHSRMVLACLLLSIAAGTAAYISLPREGAPDIEIPAYHVSVTYPGISAEDSERLLVRPLETQLQELDGLEEMQSTAAEGYAGVSLTFEFGLDRAKTLADIRENVDRAEAEFPEGANRASVLEFSFAQFPVMVVVISGDLPERTLLRAANDVQETIEALPPVLEANLTGVRDEMLEVIIDPLHLEAYGMTANELISVVSRNNQLVAAGEIETSQGSFALKIPSTYSSPQDVRGLPVKSVGGRVVTLGDLADITMTYQDRSGTSRHDGASTFAVSVVNRKGANVIDSSREVKEAVAELRADWPAELDQAISVTYTQERSPDVEGMVSQLQSSVITAIVLVMLVVLAALGVRSSLLVGFAIPTSFLLCFALLSVMQIAISNIVMFGLILAVGMLVDSAIVIVELADRLIKGGVGPMTAYMRAAKRMFWPIVSSTATTLCAFLPMLFWPGMAGQFMGTLPVTIIFVLSASLLVALVFLPVVGGVTGRLSRTLERISSMLRRLRLTTRLAVAAAFALAAIGGITLLLNTGGGPWAAVPGALLFAASAFGLSITASAIRPPPGRDRPESANKRTPFGRVIGFIVSNPIMPVVVIALVVAFVGVTVQRYMANNNGVRFFVDTEPEQVIVYVRARGNLSLDEEDAFVREVENLVRGTEGVASVFATAGAGGQGGFGAARPVDTIGSLQVEFDDWEDRQAAGGIVTDSRNIVAELESRLADIPGIRTDIQTQDNGPEQGKPLNLRLKSDNWDDLLSAATQVRQKFDRTEGLVFIEDTRPLPGIDWQIDIDVEKAGRYGADVQTVGAMLQLVTRGILLDTMRVDSSDDEIEIRVRLPESDRLLSTLDTLRVRTQQGLIPLSNFVTRTPVNQLPEISRIDRSRFIDVKSGVNPTLRNEDGRPMTPTERIQTLTTWLEEESGLPDTVSWEWTGDQQEQQETQSFLMMAFIGALGLMFAVLLAQFNSVYNSVLVLLAVVLSTVGVLIGMMVLNQPFSIIMSGTGIVALAGIVVNNNIVLIDTYQDYARYMPRLEAIIRTAEVRVRPVLLTSLTTMAGLTPMMFGVSIDLVNGGYTVDAPSALWWKQLASAVVFGLGIATALTLVFTPSVLALRVWAHKGSYGLSRVIAAAASGKESRIALDLRLDRALRKSRDLVFLWDAPEPVPVAAPAAKPAAAPGVIKAFPSPEERAAADKARGGAPGVRFGTAPIPTRARAAPPRRDESPDSPAPEAPTAPKIHAAE